jgi:hypothetical protein
MKHVVNLMFRSAPSQPDMIGAMPESITVHAGAIPQINDILGFSELCLANGNPAMFRVVNRFLSYDSQGALAHIQIVLAPESDASFLQ